MLDISDDCDGEIKVEKFDCDNVDFSKPNFL